MKIWCKSDKNKEDINFFFFQQNIPWTVDMNMQMSELMMSSPHNFPIILFTEMMKIPYFSYEKLSKTWLIFTLNKCRIMFALIYFNIGTSCFYMFEQTKWKFSKVLYTKCMGNCEAMTSSTHSFAYIHMNWLFKKCFVENYKNSKFNIFLIFYPIYINFSLFCSNFVYSFYWINLNLDWISPLISTEPRIQSVIHVACILLLNVIVN